jgi:hypothetical protein
MRKHFSLPKLKIQLTLSRIEGEGLIYCTDVLSLIFRFSKAFKKMAVISNKVLGMMLICMAFVFLANGAGLIEHIFFYK